MAEPQERWPVAGRCEGLDVSRRGLYADLPRRATADVEAAALAVWARIQALATETRHRYGRRRMANQRPDEGLSVGRAQARRLLTAAGGAVKRPKRRGPLSPDRRPGSAVAPHRLARQGDVQPPTDVWAGDITSMWTAEGWWSVSVRRDLYASNVVGWAMSRALETTVVQDAFKMARWRRQPSTGRLPHAERGRPYASQAYPDLLAQQGMVWSMRATGEGLDHAVAERGFGSVTHARPAPRDDATRQEARDDSIDDIEMSDNSRRTHSYLGYVSPNAYAALALVAELSVRFSLTTTFCNLQA